MLKLTNLGGETESFKACMIQEIKSIPETLVVLLNGNSQIVKESVEDILKMMTIDPRLLDARSLEIK
jgi:uncharacterized protein YlzI (FlbEa/FlbD family)